MMDEYLKTTSNPFKIGRHLRKTQQSSPFLITDYNQKNSNHFKTTSNFFMNTHSSFVKSSNFETKNNFYTLSNQSNNSRPKLNFVDIEEETRKLKKYYKTSIEDIDEYKYQNAHKKTLSIEEKELKTKILKKYQINPVINKEKEQKLPKIDDKTVSIKLTQPYFKSLSKAYKILNLNKQIAHKINEITSCAQIDKYSNDIINAETAKYSLGKMPKVRIKKVDVSNHLLVDNETLANLKKKKEMKKKSLNLVNFTKEENFSSIKPLLITPPNTSLEKLQINLYVSSLVRAYKPTSRALFSINIINKYLYLFGGLNSISNCDMWRFSLSEKTWSKVTVKENPVPRYGHSAVVLNESIIIYGGITPSNYFKCPEDIVIFNTVTNSFSFPRILGKIKPGNRKGHIALGISQSMLVQGGMDIDNNTLLNSAYIYHFTKNVWSELDSMGEPLPYLMYHTAVVVNDYSYCTFQPYSIYRTPGDLPSNRVKKIKFEGIYIFGGINEKKKYCNDVYVIKICRKPVKIIKARIDGIPPCPRINCQMIYAIEYNMVIIHGGCDENQNLLNDMIILNMETLNWIHPVLDNDDLESEKKMLTERTEHQMFSLNGKIFILGGRNSENYLKMDFEIAYFQISSF